MTKRSYTIAFKKEVVEYMSLGHSAYKAKHFFSSRDNFEYDPSMFRHWYKKKEALCCEESAQKKRLSGGGRKPSTQKPNATSINDVSIHASGSLLFSSKFLGHDGAAKVQLILASQSPRRAEILDTMGLKNQYIIIPSPLDEKAIQNELTEQGQNLPPAKYARILAERKAKAVASNILLLLQNNGTSAIKTEPLSNAAEGNDEKISIQKYIIGCDTIVAIDEEILEKPRDDSDARNMLSRLSDRWHNVHTGISIYSSTNNYESPITSFTETAQVKFTALTPDDIDAYIRTREHVDKAGSYGIQGIGGQIIESMKGDYYTVMGLPMHRLSRELANIINSSTV